MAEGVGFEPTVPCGTAVFKTAAQLPQGGEMQGDASPSGDVLAVCLAFLRRETDPLDPKTSRHSPQYESAAATDPAALRVILRSGTAPVVATGRWSVVPANAAGGFRTSRASDEETWEGFPLRSTIGIGCG